MNPQIHFRTTLIFESNSSQDKDTERQGKNERATKSGNKTERASRK